MIVLGTGLSLTAAIYFAPWSSTRRKHQRYRLYTFHGIRPARPVLALPIRLVRQQSGRP